MTINLSPAVNIDLVAITHDTINFPFVVRDDAKTPVDFSEFDFAKLSMKQDENSDDVITFTSTGSTYMIDLTNISAGLFTISCDALALEPDTYLYDLELSNSTQTHTIIRGRWVVTTDITL